MATTLPNRKHANGGVKRGKNSVTNPYNFAHKARLLATAAPFAFVLAASPAFAQTAPAAQAQATIPAQEADDAGAPDIVVTGTLFRRTDTETPSPVTVLKAEDLEKRGINTVAEAVQRLSSNGSGAITQGWNNGSNFATGANAVSLRGLTVQSTLTIFDGLRMAPYPLADDGHRNFVDLNTLPDAVVDRIEVLKDGASSTYGADAIAGVVNVIMKKEVTGFHLNGSAGISDKGDGAEQRFDATVGYGSLSEQGFNVYISGEYQKNDVIMARERAYPFNTADLSKLCAPGSTVNCLTNGVQFGINADGTLGAGTTTTANLVAPGNAAGGRLGAYQLLNTTLGCAVAPGLSPITLNPLQQRNNNTNVAAANVFQANQCQQDLRAQYSTIQPSQQRYGGSMRFTANIGDKAQAYATASYYDVKSTTTASPLAWASSTTAPRQVTLSPVLLPVYVCAAGVGTITGNVNISTGCTAANGTLNPNNPFAAAGQTAILRGRFNQDRVLTSDARSLRGALGINGSFGDSWTYSADFTISNVKLAIISKNYMIPQRLADVIANGTYNFVDQSKNSQAIRDYIAPVNKNISNSDLWQGQANIGRNLFDLPGGPLQAAVGVSYRHESIDNPSANPDNIQHPYDRYYTINAVGAIGSRNVKSAFFEINAPILDVLELNGSGRYDDYSSGQKNFSPKIGAKFTPIKQIAVRGTFSKGFRIPSFNEAYGLPTTGFSQAQVDCGTTANPGTLAAYCKTHSPDGTLANANAYVTAPYSLGTTLTGNPSLKPEKSTSFTAGIVVEPIRGLSFTVDYFNIEVKNLVSQVSPTDRQAAITQYYTQNGVVNIPGITVTQNVPDVQFPNALPLLGTINASYNNAGKENVSGLDLGANLTLPITGGLTLRSSFDATYLIKYTLTRVDGSVERYDGTLSPCDYTSCSGSPKWRGSWQNTLEFGNASITGTDYYTSGYNLAEVDYGGSPADCVGNTILSAGAPYFKNTAIPAACSAKAQWNFDLSAQVKVADKFTLYINALNVFNIAPVYDPAAAYSLYQYNPAWGQANIIGRYFRVGAKVDF
uniref:TonB-dependent receptor plug domain-containing protein n=1 Tax=Sphingomonas bacterium TaxID=1895847 RepID=UPI002631AF59|nr:TonB-dependent receptor [Sphingomonas bacterium]